MQNGNPAKIGLMVMARELPIFEILTEGKRYAIYYDGRTEGFNEDGIVIFNRLPLLTASIEAHYLNRLEEVLHPATPIRSLDISGLLQGEPSNEDNISKQNEPQAGVK